VDGPVPLILSCRVEGTGPARRLVVAGEIDLATVAAVTRFLGAGIAAAEPGSRLRVDLAQVVFCAAVGVRALVAAVQLGRARGVVVLFDPHSPAVALALDICGHLELTGPVVAPGPVIPIRAGRTR
jgi:anti-anti-sigma factor